MSSDFSGGRQTTSQKKILVVWRFHCTRKDNSVVRVAATFFLDPFRGDIAALRVRRSSRSAPCGRDRFQMLACFFFFFLLFPLTTADSSTRTLTAIVGEQCCNVLRVGLSPHKRKHPNAIQKKGGRHVARRMHCGQRAESRYEQDGAVFQH